jgi:hypothetical protein
MSREVTSPIHSVAYGSYRYDDDGNPYLCDEPGIVTITVEVPDDFRWQKNTTVTVTTPDLKDTP